MSLLLSRRRNRWSERGRSGGESERAPMFVHVLHGAAALRCVELYYGFMN
jgi:hypothetical protein